MTSPVLALLCHTQTAPQVYLSTGNNVVLRFVSDISNTGRGFNATYQQVDGGSLTPHPSLIAYDVKTRNSAVADKPRDVFLQIQWRS